MRYFIYNEYDPDHTNGGYVVTKSEEDIRNEYWPIWRARMIEKYGEDKVDRYYSFRDCLDEWIIQNFAWELT